VAEELRPARGVSRFPEILFGATILLMSLLWIAQAHRRVLHLADVDWDSSEWMIDYAGGFVRRGLAGTLTAWVMRVTGLGFFPVWIFSATSIYFALCAWFIRFTWRLRGPAIWRFALLFNPLLLISACEYGSFARKDIFFICGTLLQVRVAQHVLLGRGRGRRAREILLVLGGFGISSLVLVLLHEGLFVFDWLPLNLAVCAYTLSRLGVSHRRIALLLPAALAPALAGVAASLLRHGNAATAQTICASWRSAVPVSCKPLPPALDALGWSLSHALALSLGLLWKMPFYVAILAAGGGVLILTVVVLMQRARVVHLLALLLFPFAASLPLYLLGVDWGRWLCVMTSSSLMVMLASEVRPAVYCCLPRAWRLVLARHIGPGMHLALAGIRRRIEAERWAFGLCLLVAMVPQIPLAPLLLLDAPVLVMKMLMAVAARPS
jgi:hypothetical protein